MLEMWDNPPPQKKKEQKDQGIDVLLLKKDISEERHGCSNSSTVLYLE